MPETTITGLPNATTPLSGSERVPMDQAGVTKDATTADIAALAPATDLTYTAATRTLASSTGADAVLPVATTTDAGLESAADKTKLDSITVDSATLVRKLVRNNSGVSIPKGAAVYQTGSSGIVITVALADASAEATASQTLGLAQETIANNANGYVVAVGELTGLSTSALTEGQIVWLSETAGELTTTRPTQPAHGVVLGYCVKQGSGTSGILYVKVDNGLELNELHDVLISSPTAGQVLRRASDGLWKNAVLGYSDLSGLPTLPTGTNTGDQTLANTSDATSHTVSLSASGGSVQLVEGTNITLTTSGTSGAGVVTIASTGGGTPGGSTTQVQFNDGGAFGGDAGLLFNKTTNKLTTGGDVELNDGGTFTTTLQTVTPTANRTISFPDATGTIGLVAGSSGQLLYNASGANAGLSTVTTDGTNVTLTGRFISSLNGAASAPPGTFTGTWFTGGTSTTTKPQVLIEPTGATSTAWSTSGTGLGVNAASGFAGRLLDLQLNGTSNFSVSSAGAIVAASLTQTGEPISTSGATLRLVTATSTTRVTINNTGLGIGTTPSYAFHVNAGPSSSWGVTNGSTINLINFSDTNGINLAPGSSTPLIFTTGGAERGRFNGAGGLTLADANNIAVGTTTGTKIGTATTQKLGFYNATPVVQPVAVANAVDTTDIVAQFNALLARMRDLGLIAT